MRIPKLIAVVVVAMLAFVPAEAAVRFPGVPLGISLAKFQKLRPKVACKSFNSTYSDIGFTCDEELIRSAELPFRTGDNGSIHYTFSKQDRLTKITFWADYYDEDWVEAAVRAAWGAPDSIVNYDEDKILKWKRGGTRITFNPDCEDGAICVEYELKN